MDGIKKVKFLIRTVLIPVLALFVVVADDDYALSHKHMEVKHICSCTLDCMDARVQHAVEEGTQKECHVDLVDVITQAGMVKVLAENQNKSIVDNIKMELGISVKKHGTKKVTIAAHADCAGNPVSKEEQINHLRKAKQTVESWNLGVEVALLWVDVPFKKAELVK